MKNSTPRPKKQAPVLLINEDDSDNDDIIGKKHKANSLSNMNLLNIKNPSTEFVSNSSSFRPQNSKNSRLNSLIKKLNHDQGFGSKEAISSASDLPSVAHQQQQIYSNAMGVRPVTDRMSKEKQKFFRFSVFNSERKSKLVKSTKQKLLSINNNISNLKSSTNNLAITNTSTTSLVGHDKYKFESSSDSENERVNDCDTANKISTHKKGKEKNTIITKNKKSSQQTSKDCPRQSNSHVKSKQNTKEKAKKNHSLTSEDDSLSSYCSSDDENDSVSSSDTSSDSTSGSQSSSSEASSSETFNSTSSSVKNSRTSKTSLLNKTEAINTMNVFACINSRELTNQIGNSYCWSTMPFSKSHQNDSSDLFKNQPSNLYNPFGLVTRNESDNAWGFAAEAKKAVNIFNSNSDSEKSRRIKNSIQLASALNETSSFLAVTNKISKHKLANEYFATNRRTTTLMRNNVIIMSSDDDAKQLSPSKMFRKAVNYKRFDNHKLNNKKLVMDPNASDGLSADNPVKADSNSKNELSQSPYLNSKNNHLELGKKQSSYSLSKNTRPRQKFCLTNF